MPGWDSTELEDGLDAEMATNVGNEYTASDQRPTIKAGMFRSVAVSLSDWLRGNGDYARPTRIVRAFAAAAVDSLGVTSLGASDGVSGASASGVNLDITLSEAQSVDACVVASFGAAQASDILRASMLDASTVRVVLVGSPSWADGNAREVHFQLFDTVA